MSPMRRYGAFWRPRDFTEPWPSRRTEWPSCSFLKVHVMSINIYKFITKNHYYCFSPPFEVNRFISLCPQLAQIEEVQSRCDCHFSGPHIVQDAVSSRFVGFSSRTVRAKICREKMPQRTKSLVHGGVL